MRDYAVTNERDPTKQIFDEALGILIEKFPFPDKRILKLKIFETKVYHWSLYEPTDEYHESPLRFSINYGESGATLTTFNSYTDTDTNIYLGQASASPPTPLFDTPSYFYIGLNRNPLHIQEQVQIQKLIKSLIQMPFLRQFSVFASRRKKTIRSVDGPATLG